MRLGQAVGLPWFIIGTISALISSAFSLGCYQVGLFLSTSYPTLWVLPIIANIFAFINGLAAIVAIGYALLGIVLFLIATFGKK